MLNEEIENLLDEFQAECDQRMTAANEANAPKEALFHYTKEAALHSIIKSEEFWFTSIYHMDDTQELAFGFNLFRSLLREAASTEAGLQRDFCRSLPEIIDVDRIKEILAFYSVSFGLRDNSQQWTDYGDSARGVALGLAPAFFVPASFDDPDNPRPDEIIFYGKVSYGNSEGRARHSPVIKAALDLIKQVETSGGFDSKKDAPTLFQHVATRMYTEILWNCVTTKDSTWGHQNEMRLLARNILANPALPIVNAEKPRLEITQPRLKSSLVEVMIGPKAQPGSLVRMRKFLREQDLVEVPVNLSIHAKHG